MVTIHTRYNGTLRGPTRWAEVTLELYQKLVSECTDTEDRIKVMSVLYGIDYNQLLHSKADWVNVLAQASAFVWDENFTVNDSKVLIIGDQLIVAPKNFGSLTFGQAIQARKVLEQAKSYNQCLSKVTAICLQPLITNKLFSMDEVEKVEQQLLKLPVLEVYGIGCFLCSSIEELWKSNTERMESIKVPGSDQDDFIAQAAGIESLAPLADLSMIDKYAQTFCMDPDIVYDKQFNTIMNFFFLWRTREAFSKRFENMKKVLNT